MFAPGRYTVSMAKLGNGQWTELGTAQTFEARGAFEQRIHEMLFADAVEEEGAHHHG